LNGKIGTTQAAMLVVNTIAPTAFLVLPIIIGEVAEQDSPLAVLLTSLIGLAIAAIVGTVIVDNKGAPFLDWVREKCSPFIATILGLLLLQFYLDTTSTILREFVNFIKDNVLLDTPISVLTILILLITIYMVRQGIESIARINSIALLFNIFFIPIYLFGISQYMDIHRLLPIMDHSFSALTLSSLTPVTWVSEVGVLLFLAPYLQSPQKARVIGWYGLLTVAMLMMMVIVSSLMVFGPQFINAVAYPGFSAIGVIQLGRVLERMDILFISYWVMSIYLKMSIFLFATVECFKQTFQVKSSRPFIGALGLLVALESMYTWEDANKLSDYNKSRFLVFILFNALVPLALILWNRMKQLKSKKKGWET